MMSSVPNLRESIRQWRLLGGNVVHVNCTGEVLMSHPLVGRSRVNSRRKDTPRDFLKKLRRLMVLCSGQPGRGAA